MDLLWHFGMSRFFRFRTHHLVSDWMDSLLSIKYKQFFLTWPHAKPWPNFIPKRWVGHLNFTIFKGSRFHNPKKVTFSQHCQGVFEDFIKSKSSKIWLPDVRDSACWKLNSFGVAVFFVGRNNFPETNSWHLERWENPRREGFCLPTIKKSQGLRSVSFTQVPKYLQWWSFTKNKWQIRFFLVVV